MIWTHLLATWGWSALAVLVFIILAFLVALRIKKNSVADVAWGLGFVVAGATGLLYNHLYSNRQLVVMVLVALWGLRLAIHIYNRNKGKGEDFRYKELAEKGGSGALKTFTSVFLTQGALLLIVGIPVTVVMAAFVQPSLGWIDYLGIGIWIIGFFFESVGDMQLSNFIRDKKNKGKIMDKGVWKYTRHPNYFGEVTQWWGIGLITLNVPHGWIGLLGPLVITYLIVYVSGVPILEKHYEGRKDYAAYAKRTSILVPLPPKKV